MLCWTVDKSPYNRISNGKSFSMVINMIDTWMRLTNTEFFKKNIFNGWLLLIFSRNNWFRCPLRCTKFSGCLNILCYWLILIPYSYSTKYCLSRCHNFTMISNITAFLAIKFSFVHRSGFSESSNSSIEATITW